MELQAFSSNCLFRSFFAILKANTLYCFVTQQSEVRFIANSLSGYKGNIVYVPPTECSDFPVKVTELKCMSKLGGHGTSISRHRHVFQLLT